MWLDRSMNETAPLSRKVIISGVIFAVCFIISLVCLAVLVERRDPAAGFLFLSVGLSAKSAVFWMIDNL
jgi:hypothetical protein